MFVNLIIAMERTNENGFSPSRTLMRQPDLPTYWATLASRLILTRFLPNHGQFGSNRNLARAWT